MKLLVWLLIMGPLFSLVTLFGMVLVSAWLAGPTRLCPSCCYAHASTEPCVHPLTTSERMELARRLQAYEERDAG